MICQQIYTQNLKYLHIVKKFAIGCKVKRYSNANISCDCYTSQSHLTNANSVHTCNNKTCKLPRYYWFHTFWGRFLLHNQSSIGCNHQVENTVQPILNHRHYITCMYFVQIQLQKELFNSFFSVFNQCKCVHTSDFLDARLDWKKVRKLIFFQRNK